MTESASDSSERIAESDRMRSLSDYASYLSHRTTYEWARDLCQELTVVDYGCGTGYGSALIAERAVKVGAYDVSAAAIAYARAHHSAPNLSYRQISGELPDATASVDAVLSFQVIEHVDPDPYLREIRRVLKPEGFAAFATPNRLQRLHRWQKPWNQWHRTEYDPAGFRTLLEAHFSKVELFEVLMSSHLAESLTTKWRRARLLTAPFTAPFVPDLVRLRMVRLLAAIARPRHVDPLPDSPSGTAEVGPWTGRGLEILALARP